MKALNKLLKKISAKLLGIYARLRGYAQGIEWRRENQKWEAIRQEGYSYFTEEELKVTKCLIDNQIDYLRLTEQASPNSKQLNKPNYLRTTVAAIKTILVMRSIVGIQPLQGPVGLVYTMRTCKVDSDENRFQLRVTSQAAEAKTRRLQARWNIESAQDLSTTHDVNLDAELAAMMGSCAGEELAAEIINDLVKMGEINTYKLEKLIDEEGQVVPRFVGDRYAMVVIGINKVANDIGRRTGRGTGNFVVTSPIIISYLQAAPKSIFTPANDPSLESQGDFGTLKYYGMLNNSIKVYCNISNQLANKVLVGYRGRAGDVDTGYIFSPYTALALSGIVVNPQTYQPEISMMTRYAKTTFEATDVYPVSSSDYFGIVDVSELLTQ